MSDTLLTGDGSEVCGGSGSTIDGFTVMDICCKLKGRFVTIQATDTDSRPLEVAEIRITAAGKGCDDEDEALTGSCQIFHPEVNTYNQDQIRTSCFVGAGFSK